MIKESTEFPGYYHIPGFSLYVISKTGDVIHRLSKRHPTCRRNTSGYHCFTLRDDHQRKRCVIRSRLMCMTFKPTDDAPFLQVDHINCDKGDDRLENLEWVTPKENCQRAARNGLYRGARAVCVRDYDTKEVTVYESIAAAGRALGLNKDSMMYRLELNDGRVYPERKQYSFADNPTNWAEVEDIECEIARFGVCKRALLRDLETGTIMEFDKLSDLAKYVKMPHPTLSAYMSKVSQPVLPGMFQVKLKSDPSPWRDPEDPWFELTQFGNFSPVIVTEASTGRFEIYESQIKCAKARRLLPSTLNYRLKFGSPNTVYSDGCRYSYYKGRSNKEEGSTTSA